MDEDFLEELGLEQDKYLLHSDCKYAIHLINSATHHGQTKHIRGSIIRIEIRLKKII